jgi:leucine dehydrogenase
MDIQVLDALARGGFEEVTAIHDRRSGLRAFLAIHDTCAGPAFGGVRRWTYRSESEALRDVLRLSRAMTHKCVLSGLPAGGAKLVAMDGSGVDWERAYRYIGEVVERLAGRFYTGPDVGTGSLELSWMSSETGYVTSPDESGPGELADSTASGVFHGMAAALEHLDGEVDWGNRTVVVQGLGAVGSRLARSLVEVGARVLASDLDHETAERVAGELELELLDPTKELEVACDVFSPCALGGILHDLSVPRLRCRIVAGGANNVLAQSIHGDRLHERGVLYAPDFVINSGALVRGSIFHLEDRRVAVDEIGARIRGALSELLVAAEAAERPPARFAFDEAERRVSERRAASSADGETG